MNDKTYSLGNTDNIETHLASYIYKTNYIWYQDQFILQHVSSQDIHEKSMYKLMNVTLNVYLLILLLLLLLSLDLHTRLLLLLTTITYYYFSNYYLLSIRLDTTICSAALNILLGNSPIDE